MKLVTNRRSSKLATFFLNGPIWYVVPRTLEWLSQLQTHALNHLFVSVALMSMLCGCPNSINKVLHFLLYFIIWYVSKLANIALLSIRGISRGHFRSLSALICGNFQDNVGNLKEFLGCQRDWHSRHLLQFSTWKFLTYWFVEFQETCVLTFHPLINELTNFNPISIYFLILSISNFHQLPMLVLRIIAMALQWQHIQDHFLSCAWWQ